ncbi:MAG: cytochrome c maturation protein CcmE [Acidobacteriota bacterium]
MKSKTIKIAVTAAILTLAFGGLLYTTLQDGTAYYKHVDEVMTDPSAWQGKNLQLHGFVVDKSILTKPSTLEYQFQIKNKGSVVQASYRGVVPDTFKSGSEVVLKGHLGPNGFEVEPNGVMAKCPSRYEEGKPGSPGS